MNGSCCCGCPEDITSSASEGAVSEPRAAVSEPAVVASAAVAAAETAVRATVAIAEAPVAAVAEASVVVSEASVLRAAAVSEASVVVRAACITETTIWVHLRSVLAVQISERSSSAVITTVESVSHTYSRMSSWVRAAKSSSVIPGFCFRLLASYDLHGKIRRSEGNRSRNSRGADSGRRWRSASSPHSSRADGRNRWH